MTHTGEIILTLLFLPAIIWVGFWASILDIKTGKVRNSLIKKGYIFGLIVNGLLLVFSLLLTYVFKHTGIEHMKFVYFFDLLVNLMIAFALGFIFWKLDIWAAADSKIFTLFCFLIPLTVYRYNKVPYFPSFVLLVNIFVIYLLYLAISFLSSLKFKNFSISNIRSKFWLRKGNIKPRSIIVAISIFAIIFLVGTAIPISRMPMADYFPIMFYIFSFTLINPLMKLLKKKKILFLLLVAIEISYILYLAIFSDSFSFLSFGRQILYFAFNMILILTAFKLLTMSTRSERKIVQTEDIIPNMVLTQASFIRVRDKKGLKENLGPVYPDGLLEGQSANLKEFLKKEHITEIEIFKTFPFAPFIFIGAMITIFMGDFISHWIWG